ncbi:16S rRNA (uracil(1498)-N(3))-methyltransferase [Pokkaliibacter sp. CJK22405]|uniref:16S rRNA (uracil(1498)-N(3))-methyltransferase n=1 Tax=Pokkaliibacter sp. CJK22405 TaxID=3384615 RepID=UPI0039854C6C
MNLILLDEQDFIGPNQVRLSGRRFQHIQEVHRAEPGQTLAVGLRNGAMGQGQVLSLNPEDLTMSVSLDQTAPPPLPLTLILALPRPKMLRRIIQHATTLGVSRLVLINAVRVEKSFWQTPFLTEASLLEQCTLGLEQARATHMPEILLRKRFKPFVEDELPAMMAGTTAILAHPYTEQPCPAGMTTPVTLAVGPEGGFVPYEVEKLQEAGFSAVHLGPRILRVETAVPVLISKLFY